jgi:hypothetical protein
MNPHFKYWWEGAGDDGSPVAFYSMSVVNVAKATERGFPVVGSSDVTASTLAANGHEIPATPTFEFWKEATRTKRRCPHCWSVTRTPADYARHLSIHHPDPAEVRP